MNSLRLFIRVSACFNIIHCQDRNSVYRLQLYHSDIISQYGNSAPMEHFNAWGNAVDPETFRIFKNMIATAERQSTAYGNIRHYQEGVFGITHIDNKEFLVKYKEKGDKIFYITGIIHQQPSSVMKLPENDDSVRETSKEANTDTSINEPLDLKGGRKRKFEGSGTCIPTNRKPIGNYERTPAKQAELSDSVYRHHRRS